MANLAMQAYVKALLAKQKFLEEERGADRHRGRAGAVLP